MFPHLSPTLLRKLYPSLVWQIPTDKKEVFLTFDDGPTPEITEWVLDQLEKYEQKGTFFCIGNNVVKHPEIMEKILKAGHTIGNHTYNHQNGFKCSLNKYLKEVEDCAKVLQSDLFRPPYGRIKSSQLKALKSQYKIIEWSIISGDYYHKLNVKKAQKALEKHTENGSIVVFHDSVKASRNLKILLPMYLEFLKSEKYTSLAL